MTCFVQNGWTALRAAAGKGHLRVVEMLLEANADVNIKTSVSFKTVTQNMKVPHYVVVQLMGIQQ